MKKIVSLLLCCIMILFSIGCNNDKETEKNDSKKINIVPVNNKITIDNVNMDFTVKNYATNFFDIEDDITNSFEYEDDLIAIEVEVDTKGQNQVGDNVYIYMYAKSIETDQSASDSCLQDPCSISFSGGFAPGFPNEMLEGNYVVNEQGKASAWLIYKVKKGYNGPIDLKIYSTNDRGALEIDKIKVR